MSESTPARARTNEPAQPTGSEQPERLSSGRTVINAILEGDSAVVTTLVGEGGGASGGGGLEAGGPRHHVRCVSSEGRDNSWGGFIPGFSKGEKRGPPPGGPATRITLSVVARRGWARAGSSARSRRGPGRTRSSSQLCSTAWGLRVRAVGEHPTAADTVGIRVHFNRYRSVIMGGLIAGIGGAYLTIGSVGAFGQDISSGKGYIALAAMIFGRWTPLGAVGAALIFGFTDALQSILSTLNVPIPSNILLMAPYIATIVAVAGLVGHVRPPKAGGKPYIKQ